ncbi:MAG: hypothetical protein JKY09_02625 [Crocinitomicaceae bacterium]|nr:hypothetical protein [Crocinitomicaceae bacterium]
MGTIAQIFESGKQSANKGLFNNLVMLARVDGKVDEAEAQLLDRIANHLSLTEEQVKEIIDHPNNYPMIPPASKEERYDRFIQFVQMTFVDGEISPKEEKLVAKYGIALGFNEEDLIRLEPVILTSVKNNESREEILNNIL